MPDISASVIVKNKVGGSEKKRKVILYQQCGRLQKKPAKKKISARES